jgi:hypothetical protein
LKNPMLIIFLIHIKNPLCISEKGLGEAKLNIYF